MLDLDVKLESVRGLKREMQERDCVIPLTVGVTNQPI